MTFPHAGRDARPSPGALPRGLRSLLAGLALVTALATPAFGEEDALGLAWGMGSGAVVDRAGEVEGRRAFHDRYGSAIDLRELPVVLGGELHRIAYFGDRDRLLRVWVNFGRSEGRVWERHFELEQAVTKYHEVKRFAADRWAARECREPELRMVEVEERTVLAPSFEVRDAVWSCRYGEGSTRVEVALRRLGDPDRRRFDVLLDARDLPAVEGFRARRAPPFGWPGRER